MTPLHFCHEIPQFPKYEYILPNSHVVFGLPVLVPLPRRIRLQVDRPVADPLFGLPAEIGRKQFHH